MKNINLEEIFNTQLSLLGTDVITIKSIVTTDLFDTIIRSMKIATDETVDLCSEEYQHIIYGLKGTEINRRSIRQIKNRIK